MTPTEVADAARREYNASGNDPFFSDTQFFEWIYHAEMELCTRAWVTEACFSLMTVAGTQEYSYPTNMFALKRVQWKGERLEYSTFKEDDLLTGNNFDSTDTGTPISFIDFDQVLYLRPIPNEAQQLKVWGYVHPSGIPTANSSLTTPDEFHPGIVQYCLAKMAAKNKNYEGANWYLNAWERIVERAVRYQKRKRQGSQMKVVQNLDVLPQTIFGTV